MTLSIHLITELPIWFSLFCILLGVGYAVVLYRKEVRFNDVKKWIVNIMAFSRALLVAFLAFLLLSPFVKTIFNKVEKPIIIFAQDNSSSIILKGDSAYYKNEYLTKIEHLKQKLAKTYEVKSFTFGTIVKETDQIDFTEKTTNISNLFEALNNKFYNKNVGALILASDGVFNQGENPIYAAATVNYPVYTVALGDTVIPKDIVLKEVINNKITFLGNQFPVEIYAEMLQLKGTETELTIVNNGRILYSKKYNITTDKLVVNENILLDAKRIGVQHYHIKFNTLKGEVSVINNVKDIYVEVLDGRQNILILANAPHPDLKALKLSIEQNENYEVETQFVNDFDGNVKPYSLVIVHEITNISKSKLAQLNSGSTSILYVLGNQTNIKQFNNLKTGLEIQNSKNVHDVTLPNLTENFPLFTLDENTIKAIGGFPPLSSPFGAYKSTLNAHVLFSQKIGEVVTQKPLIVFYQKENKKIGIITGEGLWKWRLSDFLKNKNHLAFDELVNKTVQYLSVKEDKSKFRIIADAVFLENEEIRLKGELYNDSYELNNEPPITILLVDKKGNEYQFTFNKTNNAYLLNVGLLPVGFYHYSAKVKMGAKTYVRKGKFQVNPILLEQNNTVSNHQLLQNLATKSNGKMIAPIDLEQLEQLIANNSDITSVIYEEEDLKELIHLKWIFFMLLTLLTLEWVLRKRNGAY